MYAHVADTRQRGRGLVFKRCGCTGPDGRRLERRCERLYRADGAWHPTHGSWYYQLELPPTADGKRRILRRTPAGMANTRQAALDERDQARFLISLARDDDTARDEIASLLMSIPSGRMLPDQKELARRIRAGLAVDTGLTVGEYLIGWLQARPMDASTRSGYEVHLRLHLIPHLGHIPLDRLSAVHIEAMVTAMIARNERIAAARASDDPVVRRSVNGMGTLSPASFVRIRATLRKALNDAIRRYRLLEFNPAVYVELPAYRYPKAVVWTDELVQRWQATRFRPSPVMLWTPQQTARFLDYAHRHDPELYALYALVLRRGLRRGEARVSAASRSTCPPARRRSVIRSPVTATSRSTSP